MGVKTLPQFPEIQSRKAANLNKSAESILLAPRFKRSCNSAKSLCPPNVRPCPPVSAGSQDSPEECPPDVSAAPLL